LTEFKGKIPIEKRRRKCRSGTKNSIIRKGRRAVFECTSKKKLLWRQRSLSDNAELKNSIIRKGRRAVFECTSKKKLLWR